jgi:hypothetical protein
MLPSFFAPILKAFHRSNTTFASFGAREAELPWYGVARTKYTSFGALSVHIVGKGTPNQPEFSAPVFAMVTKVMPTL